MFRSLFKDIADYKDLYERDDVPVVIAMILVFCYRVKLVNYFLCDLYTSVCIRCFRWSKTRQHRDRLLFVPLPSIPGSPLCPVSAILQYFALVPDPASAPFFCILRGGGLRPITHAIFTNSIKALTSKIGLRPSDFSPHNIRRGGATFAFQAGVPERLIQQHGDWRSHAFQRYLSLPLNLSQWLLTLWPLASPNRDVIRRL